MEIGDGGITWSVRQRELQKVVWDNSHGGRMEEWSSRRKSPWNKGN